MTSLLIIVLSLFGIMFKECKCQPSFSMNLNATCYQTTARFDTSALECQACSDANQAVADDGQLCTCAGGYKKLQNYGTSDLLSFNCTSCLTMGMAATADRSRCMHCQNVTASLDTVSGECTCRQDGYVLVEKDQAGNWLANKTCLECPTNSIALASDPYTCAFCSHPNAVMSSSGSCTCSTGYNQAGDDWCVLSTYASSILGTYPLSTAATITYTNIVSAIGEEGSSESLSSYPFEQNFLAASSECKNNRNRTACNALANMCAIASYNEGHPTCAFAKGIITTESASGLNSTHGFAEWVISMPLLYYTDTKDNAAALDFQVAVEEKLNFLLAKYSINGTYQGYEVLDGHLQLCGRNPDSKPHWQDIGNAYDNNCIFDLAEMVAGTKGTEFYSLFVTNPSQSRIYPVPITATDYTGSESTSVGRFFLVDVDSSKTGANSNPALVQWASNIHLSIPVQKSSTELLYPPKLTISYSQRKWENVHGSGSRAEASFSVEYTGTFAGMWTAGIALFSVAIVAITVIWLAKTYAMWRLQSISFSTLSWTTILRILLKLAGVASDVLLWIVGFLACLSFVLFKGQSTLYILLPSESGSETEAFRSVLIFIFFGKLAALSVTLWDQMHADVFFFDWEKPQRSDPGKPATVSVWRRILIINRYNDLQVTRLVSIPLTVFLLLLFLIALRLEGLGLNLPSFVLAKEGVTGHSMLQFAVVLFAWVLVGGSQLMIRRVCYNHFVEDLSASFNDLLHSANISCLLMDNAHHGYYIHGKTVHQHADTDLKDLNQQVTREMKLLVKERGLLPGKDTWEMFLHPRFRRQYERVYKNHLRRNLLHSQELRRDLKRATEARGRDLEMDEKKMGDTDARFRDLDEEINAKLMEVSNHFNTFLKNFVMGNDPVYSWREATPGFLFRTLGLPPSIESKEDNDGQNVTSVAGNSASLFYHDSERSYTSLFLMGIEPQLLTFLMMLHAVTDIAFSSTPVSLLVVLGANMVLEYIRMHFGKDNIAKKTMLHARFFL